MGLFGRIKDKIFGQSAEKPEDAGKAGPSRVQKRQGIDTPGTSGAAVSNIGPGASGGRVDVEKSLDEMAKKSSQELDWRHSIVDLMKLVGMDSSLSERRELADELGYDGDKGDTATMNIWLHKQVMKKLEENGGRVPREFLD